MSTSKVKTFLVVGLLLVISMVLIAGCTGSDSVTDQQDSSVSQPEKPTAAPTQTTKKMVGVRVGIDYDGDWQGSIGYDGNIKSVAATGFKSYTLDSGVRVVSVSAQKMDGSTNVLKVGIFKDDKMVAFESTDAPYGVAVASEMI